MAFTSRLVEGNGCSFLPLAVSCLPGSMWYGRRWYLDIANPFEKPTPCGMLSHARTHADMTTREVVCMFYAFAGSVYFCGKTMIEEFEDEDEVEGGSWMGWEAFVQV